MSSSSSSDARRASNSMSSDLATSSGKKSSQETFPKCQIKEEENSTSSYSFPYKIKNFCPGYYPSTASQETNKSCSYNDDSTSVSYRSSRK